ncbi:MAG: hypothetical protein K0U68_04150, partial [Gammaproteobacteria bacterium]|nr:hypothetical protein [Gammaproteobacteria bacterium]
IHIIHGQNGPWPAVIDLQTNNLPPASTVRITQIFGANGDRPNDTGDVLSYSGTAADINNDGRIDLITNEMVGNGTGFNGVDRGNLIVISGALLSNDNPPDFPGFEFGNIQIDHRVGVFTSDTIYNDPVVILGPPTFIGHDPGVAALTSVNSGGFAARFKEWDYRARQFGDRFHLAEQTAYLIGERGRFVFSDGSIWELGTFILSGTGQWRQQNFQSVFPAAPSLFLTAQTMNGAQTFTVRARRVSATGFDASIFEEEFLNDGHVDESIGYLAVYSPNGSGLIEAVDTSQPYELDNTTLNHQFRAVSNATLRLQEEQSRDAETQHVGEHVNTLTLTNSSDAVTAFFSQIVSAFGLDTVTIRKQAP